MAERDLLVRKLRSEDRQDEADAVAGLRKPSIVVFAVNRAACDWPKAARATADAACKVKDAQVGNQPETSHEWLKRQAKEREQKQREREQVLREDLAEAERRLEAAVGAVRAAELEW